MWNKEIQLAWIYLQVLQISSRSQCTVKKVKSYWIPFCGILPFTKLLLVPTEKHIIELVCQQWKVNPPIRGVVVVWNVGLIDSFVSSQKLNTLQKPSLLIRLRWKNQKGEISSLPSK